MKMLLWFLAAILPGLSVAQSMPPVPATPDDSRFWAAVGLIQVDGGGFCTGTLISPSHVLTAGHCVYDQGTGALFETARIEFRAGWRAGLAEASRNIRALRTHPGYTFAAGEGVGRVARDIALLELDVPIQQPWIKPMALAELPALGAPVGVISYSHNRADAPSVQEVCHLMAKQDEALILDCDVDFGSSGAPIFRYDRGVPEIVSVVAAKAMMGGMSIALGAQVQEKIEELE